MTVNIKRVHRLWLADGLRVLGRRTKRQREIGAVPASSRRRATRRNEVWSYDFVLDQTEDGRPFKWLTVCAEHHKETFADQS